MPWQRSSPARTAVNLWVRPGDGQSMEQLCDGFQAFWGNAIYIESTRLIYTFCLYWIYIMLHHSSYSLDEIQVVWPALDAHWRAGYLGLVIPAAFVLRPTGTASPYTLSMVFPGFLVASFGVSLGGLTVNECLSRVSFRVHVKGGENQLCGTSPRRHRKKASTTSSLGPQPQARVWLHWILKCQKTIKYCRAI